MKGLVERVYHLVFKRIWPFWVGGVILALLNILYLLIAGEPWRITTGFTYWGAWIVEQLGGNPRGWTYFQGHKAAEVGHYFLSNDQSYLNFGLVIGALLSVLLAGQFKLKKIKNKKQALYALAGGIIMGYATRIALGCNIGAFFSAVPSQSLSGYVFGIFVFIGAWLGSLFLMKFMVK